MPAGAAADCERILEGWWGQPVNTVTAFAFVAAGIVVFIRHRSGPASLLIAGVGAGSIAFHGPMPPWGEFVHDLTIGCLLVWILLAETGRRRWWPYAFGLIGLLMVTPTVADPAQALLAALAIISVLRFRRPRWVPMLSLLSLGAIVGTLSRTGGPWCDPSSIWQGHGFWHLASAAALTLWAEKES